jgi:ABC-type transport system substrate-binding protein
MAMTRRAFTALAACSTLSLTGCGEPGPPPPRLFGSGATGPRRGGTLALAISADLSTLDPAQWMVWTLGDALFDKLLDYAPGTAADPMELVPGLCERWSVHHGGTVYKFHLRPGARFSNGEPVIAEDFVYTLDRILDPEVGSPGAQFYAGIVGAEERLAGRADRLAGVRAIDDRTLEIRLGAPDPAFPHLAALPFMTPQKRRHVEEVGPRLRERPLGTGPFMLREWIEGASAIVDRNPFYWDPERPFLDRIRVAFGVPRSVAGLRLLRGEIAAIDTFASISTDDLPRFTGSPAWQPYTDRSPAVEAFYLLFNTERPPFTDRRVRRALSYAVNREEIVRLLNGLGVVANGIVPPPIPGHRADRPPCPHDPDMARRLLADAGHAEGLDIACIFLHDDRYAKIAQSIQADLASVGVRLHLQSLSNAAMQASLNRRDFDLWYTGWYMDFPDPWDYLLLFHSRMIAPENGLNQSLYSNPAVDRLLDEARHEMDGDARIALYRRAEDIVCEDCPCAFLYFPIHVQVRQPYLMGCRMHPARPEAFRHAWLDQPEGAP